MTIIAEIILKSKLLPMGKKDKRQRRGKGQSSKGESTASKRNNRKGRNKPQVKNKENNRGGRNQSKRAKKRENIQKELQSWEDHWKDFTNKVMERACTLVDIDGDGNCLFRSISEQIFGNEFMHKSLRKLCVEYMKANEDTLKFYLDVDDDMDFEDYVEHMAEDGAWAGYFELYCLCMVLEVNFVVVMHDMNVIQMMHHDKEKTRTFFLAFHDDEPNNIPEHYSSLRLLDETDLKKGAGSELPFAKQIPLETFMPILTNNAERIEREKQEAKSGAKVVFGKRKTRKQRKKDKEKKKEEMKEGGNCETASDGEKTGNPQVPKRINPKTEYFMNMKLMEKLVELELYG